MELAEYVQITNLIITSFFNRLSSGLGSGSLGVGGAASPLVAAFLGFFGLASFFVVDFGVSLPFEGFGVALSLIFGFFTDSLRCGV